MHLPALTSFLLFGTEVAYIAVQGLYRFVYFSRFDNVTEFHPNMLSTTRIIQLYNEKRSDDVLNNGCGVWLWNMLHTLCNNTL